jgi:hypothetical protein
MSTINHNALHYIVGLFQPSNIAAIYNERVAIVLGFSTLVSSIMVFLSCRTCVTGLQRLGIKNPLAMKGYALFYKYHLFYWWAFGVLLIAHLMLAALHTGLPQAGDPDAGTHWIILGMGLFSTVSAIVLFSSCRFLPGLITMATRINPIHNLTYKAFFHGHSFYWGALLLLIIVHVIVSFRHAGIWPVE